MKTNIEELRLVAPAQPQTIDTFIELISTLTGNGNRVLHAVKNRGEADETSTQLSYFPEGITSTEIPYVKLVGILSVSKVIDDPRAAQDTTAITAYTILDVGGFKQITPIKEIMVDLDFVDPESHDQPELIREALGPRRGPLGDAEVYQLVGLLTPLMAVQRSVEA